MKKTKSQQNQTEQYKKQIAILQQKIQFLEEQLQQQQSKQQTNKKINQSIMLTYQQSQNYRSDYAAKQIQRIKSMNESTVKKLKDMHYREVKRLQSEIQDEKRRYEKLLIQTDKRNVEFQRKIVEIKKVYQQQLTECKNDIEKQYQAKQELMKQKIKHIENQAEISIYRQPTYNRSKDLKIISQSNYRTNGDMNYPRQKLDVYKSREDTNYDTLEQKYSYQNKQNYLLAAQNKSGMLKSRSHSQYRKSRIREIQQSNLLSQQLTTASRESVKLLARRIDKATTQLKHSANIHQKISKRLSKK